MKKLFLLATVGVAMAAQAQTDGGGVPQKAKEGRVVYERTMQMGQMRPGGNLPPEVQAQMDRMPRTRTDQFELLFNQQHSLYQFLPNAADESGGANTFSGGGVTIQMRGGQNDVTYVDYAKGTRVDQREMMNRNFVVTDTVQRLKWKLSEETKTILNFTARKATATTVNQRPRVTMENGEMKREMVADTAAVVAWYTTDVPVPTGPNYTGQLPGLILEMNVNNGQSVIKAIEFSPKVAAAKIKEPGDGKRMTAAEFTKEREKMMEEMRKNMRDGNVIRMQ